MFFRTSPAASVPEARNAGGFATARVALVAGMSSLVLVASACSGQTGSPDAEGGDELAFERCMTDAGWDLDDLGPPPTELTDASGSAWRDPAFNEALDRCVVQTGVGEVEGDEPAEIEDATRRAIAFVECMRNRGWDVPDPEPAPQGGLRPPTQLAPPDGAGAADAFAGDMDHCSESTLSVGVESH